MNDNKETAQEDDSVLGEEMVNVCLENPEKAIAFNWLFSFSIAEFDKENGIDSVTTDIFLRIKEELGEELCIWCSKNFNGLRNLSSILDSFVETMEVSIKKRDKLKQLIELIASNNKDARITPLISASGAKNELLGISELFERANINYVRDVSRLLTLTIEEKYIAQLTQFIKWLSADKKTILTSKLHNLSSKVRDEEIIRRRVEGGTLEQISTDYAMTHEGVRQIEKKFQARFGCYITEEMPHYILYAFSQNSGYISINDITTILDDLSDIFIYYLKKTNCSTAHWADELNGFIIGNGRWYEQLKEYKEGFPEILDYESVDDLITDIIDHMALPIAFNDTRKIVLFDYRLSGKVYLKKKISLSQMYYAVLEKYYPNGIKLYDNSEAIRFRNYVRGLFGDVYLPESNRAIDVRLTDLTILCDRGKRILPSGIKIPRELLQKIHDEIIKFNRNEIMFRALFEKFQKELLENSNITNKYFLQGVLKQNFSDEFDFTRYTLKKEYTYNTRFAPTKADCQ